MVLCILFFFSLFFNYHLFFSRANKQNQIVQHHPKSGIIASSSDLALQSVQIHQAGNYTCIASNVEGDGESNTAELKVMCMYFVLHKLYVIPLKAKKGVIGRIQ